jgi:putative ABC transport system ATP-binding protein
MSAPSTTLGRSVFMHDVRKVYGHAETAVEALRSVSLEIPVGEFVVVLGPSGSGKTTLLNVIGGIEPPTSGDVEVAGVNLGIVDVPGRTEFRRRSIGFVFQFFNLVPTLTALENVQLIAELVGRDGAASRAALAEVDLADRADHFPGMLSGGEQQRVAIARALVKHPPLVLADEPTGSLDLDTGRQVLSHLRRVTDGEPRTVLLVTHNSAIAQMADRVVHMHSGVIDAVDVVASPIAPEAVTW